jgi:exonuclease SbcD
MKILHFADLHLGVETYGRLDQDGLSTRLKDFLSALDQVVDFAIDSNKEERTSWPLP